MSRSPRAGPPADASDLADVPRRTTAYYTPEPDPSVPAQRVAFGTSGHRGSSLDRAFNERHILAITQAICLYRWLIRRLTYRRTNHANIHIRGYRFHLVMDAVDRLPQTGDKCVYLKQRPPREERRTP